MKTNTTARLVGMISRPLEDLSANVNGSANEIRLTIGRLQVREGKKTFPGNWRLDCDEPKTSTGGCFFRVFASGEHMTSNVNTYSQHYGPDITYGDLREYTHAAAAMKTLQKRMHEMYETRGNACDAAAALGEFCEAAGVTEVWIAEAGARSGWLNDTDWQVCTIADTIRKVRRHLPAEVAKRKAAEVQEVAS